MCVSISMIFSTDEGSRRVEVNLFSTARTIPPFWLVPYWIPTAVLPSFTASMAYSTWNNLYLHIKLCQIRFSQRLGSQPSFRREGVHSSIIFTSSLIHVLFFYFLIIFASVQCEHSHYYSDLYSDDLTTNLVSYGWFCVWIWASRCWAWRWWKRW